MKLLEAVGVHAEFGRLCVLDGVDFAMDQGELVGLIGPNGAGKTTLLRILAGLQQHRADKIHFLGRPMSSLRAKQLARELAYLPQGNQSHWPISVYDLVMLGRLPHLRPWRGPGRGDHDVVDQALLACDVTQFAGRSVETLSGGERARVMLARALAVEPRLLLADEPIAGLDPGHQLDVMDRFCELRDRGMGIVVVMHDLSLAARYCDRIVLLNRTQVIADGKPDHVLSANNLARGFEIRAHIALVEGNILVVPLEKCGAISDPGAS